MTPEQEVRDADPTAKAVRAVLDEVNREAEAWAIAFQTRGPSDAYIQSARAEKSARVVRQALACYIAFADPPVRFLRMHYTIDAADRQRHAALADRVDKALTTG